MTTKRTHRTNRILIGAAAMVGVLAGAAGISAAVTGGDGSDPAPSLPRAEAEAVATGEVPGTVVGVEADEDDGRSVWSIDVDGEDGRRHEVEVDEDGTVVGRDVDDDDGRDEDGRDDDATDPALVEAATVTQEEAERAALDVAPGTVHRTHIEREDGTVVWEVEVDGEDGRRTDVQVDAASGAVLEVDRDD